MLLPLYVSSSLIMLQVAFQKKFALAPPFLGTVRPEVHVLFRAQRARLNAVTSQGILAANIKQKARLAPLSLTMIDFLRRKQG